MKTYNKLLRKIFSKNLARLLVLVFMSMLSIAIVTAIGGLSPRMQGGINYLLAQNPSHNVSYYRFLADGIRTISFLFPPAFILVTMMLIYITISRLTSVERAQNACLISLGYKKQGIVFKYILFTLVAVLLGSAVGIILGHFAIHNVLYNAISGQLTNFPVTPIVQTVFGGVSLIVLAVFSGLAAGITSFASLRGTPAQLLLPKSPKAGKKILFERMGFFWRRLPFKHKSTLRNVFRYKMRLALTMASTILCTVLVFLGVSLSFSLRHTNPEIMDMILPISVVLAAAAIILNALSLYNITNINIEERRTEIATLRVLGYHNREVCGYVFREISILTAMGIIPGLPIGYFAMWGLFEFLDFGGIQYVGWYVWFIVAAVSIASLAITFLLLFRKITSTKMSESLKSVG